MIFISNNCLRTCWFVRATNYFQFFNTLVEKVSQFRQSFLAFFLLVFERPIFFRYKVFFSQTFFWRNSISSKLLSNEILLHFLYYSSFIYFSSVTLSIFAFSQIEIPAHEVKILSNDISLLSFCLGKYGKIFFSIALFGVPLM